MKKQFSYVVAKCSDCGFVQILITDILKDARNHNMNSLRQAVRNLRVEGFFPHWSSTSPITVCKGRITLDKNSVRAYYTYVKTGKIIDGWLDMGLHLIYGDMTQGEALRKAGSLILSRIKFLKNELLDQQ